MGTKTHPRTDPQTGTHLHRVGLLDAGTCWGRSGGLRLWFSTQKHLGLGRNLSIQYLQYLPSSSGRFRGPVLPTPLHSQLRYVYTNRRRVPADP